MSQETENYNFLKEKLETLTERVKELEEKREKREENTCPNELFNAVHNFPFTPLLLAMLTVALLATPCFILDTYYGYNRSLEGLIIIIASVFLVVIMLPLAVCSIIEKIASLLGFPFSFSVLLFGVELDDDKDETPVKDNK